MNIEDIEIIIIGNKRKNIITSEYMGDIPYRIFYTVDYDLPRNFKMPKDYYGSGKYPLGTYRCFKGHQDALLSSEKEIILIFEDDAVPNRIDWKDIVLKSTQMLNEFEIVSLHGRLKTDNICFYKRVLDLDFYIKKYKNKFSKIQGSLSYLIKKETIKKMTEMEFIGNPMDLIIANEFNYCLLKDSPFDHDRKEGSLVEGKNKNV